MHLSPDAGAAGDDPQNLTHQAVTDWSTTAIAVFTLGLLWRFKLGEPYVVVATGALGILLH